VRGLRAEDAEGWTPDELLVPALLAGSPTTMADLSPHDRAWAVAALKLEGLTAEAIKDRLGCSLRLVRAELASPGAVMARLYLIEREAFADTLRMTQADVARLDRERAQAERAAERYKAQLDRLLDRLQLDGTVPTFPKCGHPKTRYNTYRAPKTGKQGCRRCRTDAQTRYRAKLNGHDGDTAGVHNGPGGGQHGTQGTSQRTARRTPVHVEVIAENRAVSVGGNGRP